MAWVNWSRKPANEPGGVRGGPLGLDLSASRARAASFGPDRCRTVLLDDPHEELPLAVSLEWRNPEVGRPAVHLCRRLPHLACLGFLPQFGHPQQWRAGRHCIDAADALELTFRRLRPVCEAFDSIALALPTYLTPSQVTKLVALATRNRLPVRGSVSTPLALAADLAALVLDEGRNPAPPDATWTNEDDSGSANGWVVPLPRQSAPAGPASVLIVDADDYALTASVISFEVWEARLLATAPLPRASVRAFKDRLLDALADRCVRLCRRDPRDSATAEQALYEQIDDALDRTRSDRPFKLTVRSDHWYQDIPQQPDDFDGYCANLVRQAVAGVRELVASVALPEPPRWVWLTHAAGRLPGLAAALHQNVAERTAVSILPPQATARAAARLAGGWKAGNQPHPHLDAVIPLVSVEGPALGTRTTEISPRSIAREQ